MIHLNITQMAWNSSTQEAEAAELSKFNAICDTL